MITHAGARTRALYMWEETDLELRKGVKTIKTITQAVYMINSLEPSWRGIIEITGIHNFCKGRKHIRIASNEVDLMVVHELTHAIGYGSPSNPHNRAFAMNYIKMMVKWYKWDKDELMLQAMWRGLV